MISVTYPSFDLTLSSNFVQTYKLMPLLQILLQSFKMTDQNFKQTEKKREKTRSHDISKLCLKGRVEPALPGGGAGPPLI